MISFVVYLKLKKKNSIDSPKELILNKEPSVGLANNSVRQINELFSKEDKTHKSQININRTSSRISVNSGSFEKIQADVFNIVNTIIININTIFCCNY